MDASQDRWDNGLRKRWKKQLKYLRANYAHAILLSDVNDTDIDIKSVSASRYKNFTAKEEFDFDKAIMHTDYSIGLQFLKMVIYYFP